MTEAVPAHDVEAERILVATAMLDPACLADMMAIVRPDDCYQPEHRELLGACYALAESGVDVEPSAVRAWLLDRGRFAHAGGAEKMAWFCSSATTTVDPTEMARRVALLGGVRRVDEVMRRRAAEARAPIADMRAWLSDAAQDVNAAADAGLRAQRETMRDAATVAKSLLARITTTTEGATAERRIGTGLASLDRKIGKLARQAVHIVAARPGVGKSALAQQIVLEAGRRGVRCLLCTIEMPAEDLLSRSVAWISGVNHSILELSQLAPTDSAYRYVLGAIDEVSRLPIVYEDSTSMTIGSIRGAVRRAERLLGGPIDLIAVDYMQKIQTDQRKGASRTELLGGVSSGLLCIARDFDAAVLAVSQLNRPLKGAKEIPPPKLEDLRECGDFEQDARVVMGLHRKDLRDPVGPVDVHVLKCRQGGHVGIVELTWTGPTMSYADNGGGFDDEPTGRSGSWSPATPPPRPFHEPVEQDFGFSEGF